MYEETKQAAIWSTTLMIVILGAILMVSNCTQKEQLHNQEYRTKCIELGREMVLVPGTTTTYTCKL